MSKETSAALNALRNSLKKEPPGPKAGADERLQHMQDEAGLEAFVSLVGAALGFLERIAIAQEKIATAQERIAAGGNGK